MSLSTLAVGAIGRPHVLVPTTHSGSSRSSWMQDTFGTSSTVIGTVVALGAMRARRASKKAMLMQAIGTCTNLKRAAASRATRVGMAADSDESRATSRVVAIVGRDGVGKSKVCAALLELKEPDAPPPMSNRFAEKSRLLEIEPAEGRRNFTCYNHLYSQQSPIYHKYSPRLHIIDTPGHVDRLPYVEQALRKAHVALLVCDHSGIDLAASQALTCVQESGKPFVVMFNGIDQLSDAKAFDSVVHSLEQQLAKPAAVLFAPAFVKGEKNGTFLINVLDGTVCTALECKLDLDGLTTWGETSTAAPVPESLADVAASLKEKLVDAIAAVDDTLMEAYMEFDADVPRYLIEQALRRSTAAGKLVPLLAGCAKSGVGMDVLEETLLDLTGNIATQDDKVLHNIGFSPAGGLNASPKAPFLGWACGHRCLDKKTFLEVRVLSGKVSQDEEAQLKAVGAGDAELVFDHVQVLDSGTGGNIQHATVAGPGDMVLLSAPAGLRVSQDKELNFLVADKTLKFHEDDMSDDPTSQSTQHRQHTYVLDMAKLDKGSREQLQRALQVITRDDVGLSIEQQPATGVHLLSCTGALHLDLLRERLAQEFKIGTLPVGQPYVAYSATIRGHGAGTGKHELEGKTKVRKGIEHKKANKVDARAKVEVKPGPLGTGVEVEDICNQKTPGKVSKELLKELEKGIHDGLRSAGPGGVPITDIKVRLTDADVENAEAAAAAAAEAVQLAVQEVHHLALLEPVVEMAVDVPEEDMDDVVVDLECRRGSVAPRPPDAGIRIIDAEVPYREILNYSKDLQKLTHGKGAYVFRFHGYQEVQSDLQKKIEQELREVQA